MSKELMENKLKTIDVKDKFLVIHADESHTDNMQLLQKKVLDAGGLGVIAVDEESEIYTLDPKDKFVVFKSSKKYDTSGIEQLLKNEGALGLVSLDKESDIQVLSIKEVEQVLSHMKKVKYAQSGNN